jgi:hypothetical protein
MGEKFGITLWESIDWSCSISVVKKRNAVHITHCGRQVQLLDELTLKIKKNMNEQLWDGDHFITSLSPAYVSIMG